jgi:hypothetical protein
MTQKHLALAVERIYAAIPKWPSKGIAPVAIASSVATESVTIHGTVMELERFFGCLNLVADSTVDYCRKIPLALLVKISIAADALRAAANSVSAIEKTFCHGSLAIRLKDASHTLSMHRKADGNDKAATAALGDIGEIARTLKERAQYAPLGAATACAKENTLAIVSILAKIAMPTAPIALTTGAVAIRHAANGRFSLLDAVIFSTPLSPKTKRCS